MSGELKITTEDGKSYWFGKDERFPGEVRIYGAANQDHWAYIPTNHAHEIVRQGLEHGGEVQQGDPVLFFDRAEHTPAG
ncbi:MAG TPA: hypothetical protein VFI42_15625 [Thermomicrobiaceae bacterium]|nr:hypothetical protein [Thermomicrobiaceae bacterium]